MVFSGGTPTPTDTPYTGTGVEKTLKIMLREKMPMVILFFFNKVHFPKNKRESHNLSHLFRKRALGLKVVVRVIS